MISYPSGSCKGFECCFVVIGFCPDFLKQSSGVVWVCLLSFMFLVIQRHSAVVPVFVLLSIPLGRRSAKTDPEEFEPQIKVTHKREIIINVKYN